MKITTMIGSAGTRLSRTELVSAAGQRTGVLCGQAYGVMAARGNRVRLLTLDVADADAGIVAPRPQFHQIPTTKQQWRLPPCLRERRL